MPTFKIGVLWGENSQPDNSPNKAFISDGGSIWVGLFIAPCIDIHYLYDSSSIYERGLFTLLFIWTSRTFVLLV